MSMFESILAKILFEVLRRPVLRLIPRYWYRLRDHHALPVFKSLHPRVVGLREQVKERDVDDSALAVLAAELGKLSIFPPAIRRERGRASLESELELLRVRLFFVEKFSPYSWAFLPADASLQCSVRGDSNQASTYPRLSGGQPSLETVPNTVGLSPSGALPSGHSRGVLVRFHGQGDRPVMALTTGFQGRRFDVPEARTGVPRIDLPSPAPCAAADAVFADAKAFLSSNEARQMSESELERELHRRGQKLVRKLLQGHHDQRSPGQVAGPEDASGVECSARREQDSHAETTSGTMQVVGLGCARRGHDGLHPLDAALNLLPERSLVDMRRRVTIATASRGTTAYALEATVVLDIIHVAAAMRRAVLVAQLIEGLSAFGPRPDGSRPAHGDTWLQLRRSSSRHGPPAH